MMTPTRMATLSLMTASVPRTTISPTPSLSVSSSKHRSPMRSQLPPRSTLPVQAQMLPWILQRVLLRTLKRPRGSFSATSLSVAGRGFPSPLVRHQEGERTVPTVDFLQTADASCDDQNSLLLSMLSPRTGSRPQEILHHVPPSRAWRALERPKCLRH